MKRIPFIALLVCLFASSLNAAVTYDATSTGNVTSDSAQITDSITVGSGNNRLLMCGVTSQTFPQQTISSATLGAQSMDADTIGYIQNDAANTRTWIVFLKAPNSGTATVTVNFSDVSTWGLISCVSVEGADQSSTFGTPGTSKDESGGGTTSTSVAVTLPTDGMVFDVAMTRSGLVMNATGNNTARSGLDASGSVYQVVSTNATDGTMSWDWSDPEWTAQIAIPINAAVIGGGTAKTVRVIVVE